MRLFHRCEALVVLTWASNLEAFPRCWTVRGHPVQRCGMAASYSAEVPGQRLALLCHHHGPGLKRRRPDARVSRVRVVLEERVTLEELAR